MTITLKTPTYDFRADSRGRVRFGVGIGAFSYRVEVTQKAVRFYDRYSFFGVEKERAITPGNDNMIAMALTNPAFIRVLSDAALLVGVSSSDLVTA